MDKENNDLRNVDHDDEFHDSKSEISAAAGSHRSSPALPDPFSGSRPESAASTSSSAKSRIQEMNRQQALHRKQQAQAEVAKPYPMNDVSTSVTDDLPTTASCKTNQVAASSERNCPIANKPDGGDDGDDPEEEEEDILDPDIRAAAELTRLLWSSLVDVFVVLPLLALPALLVFLLVDFRIYDFIIDKGPDNLNLSMEFIRYSVFVILAYGTFIALDLLSLVIPELTVTLLHGKEGSLPKTLRRHMRYFIAIRGNVAICAWLWALLPLGASILYQSSFTVPTELIDAAITRQAEAAVAEGNEAGLKKILEGAKRTIMSQYCESVIAVLAIFSLVIAVEKYIISSIALNFHRIAFAERIAGSNARFSAIARLYDAVTKGSPRLLSDHRLALLDLDSTADLSTDTILQLSSVHRARSIAKVIFRTLTSNSPGKQFVEAGDLKTWISGHEEAFKILDSNCYGRLSQEDFEEEVIEIHDTRDALLRSLKANGSITKKLDGILRVAAYIIGAVGASPFFDVGVGKAWSAFSVVSAGFGFMFQDTGKTSFQALTFVFIQHTYDVGDRVVIDGENYVVEDIEIFTTKLTRWDGVLVYVANNILASKVIHNIRRSNDQCIKSQVKIPSGATTESLWLFKEKLTEMMRSETGKYTGYVDLADLEKLPAAPGKEVDISVIVQVRGNFQNQARYNARKADILAKLDSALVQAGMK
jgi:small-conductance mechanosensitive channel